MRKTKASSAIGESRRRMIRINGQPGENTPRQGFGKTEFLFSGAMQADPALISERQRSSSLDHSSCQKNGNCGSAPSCAPSVFTPAPGVIRALTRTPTSTSRI
ncbi:hypothetical protein MPLA_1390182 [Mesorhizobium sp. ORS 3359]|nr:hypothetical protein MPLA_1390182 [Mesorhizobium sp. ORS 3359]